MRDLEQISKGLWVYREYTKLFKEAGLDSIEKICNFQGGQLLNKKGLASFRKRVRFELDGKTFYLKLYNHAPCKLQLQNWLDHRKKAPLAKYDMGPIEKFRAADIKTPKVIAYGAKTGLLFEKISLLITENISDATSLEKATPSFFDRSSDEFDISKQKDFARDLGKFAQRFHNLGLRHRDFYLCHIFWGKKAGFYLIDLQRVFKPIFAYRFRVKDIAQLFYSSPSSVYSRTMKLRFYLSYTNTRKLTAQDKRFLGKVFSKALKMKRHDLKKSRSIPFEN